jgi:hypothetical protein
MTASDHIPSRSKNRLQNRGHPQMRKIFDITRNRKSARERAAFRREPTNAPDPLKHTTARIGNSRAIVDTSGPLRVVLQRSQTCFSQLLREALPPIVPCGVVPR